MTDTSTQLATVRAAIEQAQRGKKVRFENKTIEYEDLQVLYDREADLINKIETEKVTVSSASGPVFVRGVYSR